MADADITAKDTLVKGVNSTNNYVRSEAHLIDGVEDSGILAIGTHDLFVIPKGNLLVNLRAVALADTASSGVTRINFAVKFVGGTSTALGTPVVKGSVATGDEIALSITGMKAYDADNGLIVQLTAGTTALTAFKALVIAEYIPVTEFITAG